jgi:hypothetical protein
MTSVNRTTFKQNSAVPASPVHEGQQFSVKGKQKARANKSIGVKVGAPKFQSHRRTRRTDGAPGNNGSEGVALPLGNNQQANDYGMLLSALAPRGMATMGYGTATYNAPDPLMTYLPISGGSVVGFRDGQIQNFYPEGLQNPAFRLEFTQPDILLVSPDYSGPMFAAPLQVQQNFNTRLQEAVQQANSLSQVWQPLASFPPVPQEMLESWRNEAVGKFPAHLPGIPDWEQPQWRRLSADRRNYVTTALQAFLKAQAPA